MVGYVVRRLGTMVVTLWVIVTLTFALMHAVPGGPFSSERHLPPAVLENLNAKYHLDWPLWRQYLGYLWGIARWDLGPSLRYPDRTVEDIIRDGFPVSLTLGVVSLAFAVTAGVLLGTLAALRQHRWQDHLVLAASTVGYSVPNYVLAAVLIDLFAYRWHWLPAARWGTPAQAVMPVLTLAAFPTAVIARLVRSAMLEALAQDYVRAARAKGLPERVVVFRHALRNALLPVLTYLGPLSALLLTGNFVVEHVFAIPGLGSAFVDSISNRDYTLIMGTTVFFGVFLLLANFAVDIVHGLLDPRVRAAGEHE